MRTGSRNRVGVATVLAFAAIGAWLFLDLPQVEPRPRSNAGESRSSGAVDTCAAEGDSPAFAASAAPVTEQMAATAAAPPEILQASAALDDLELRIRCEEAPLACPIVELQRLDSAGAGAIVTARGDEAGAVHLRLEPGRYELLPDTRAPQPRSVSAGVWHALGESFSGLSTKEGFRVALCLGGRRGKALPVGWVAVEVSPGDTVEVTWRSPETIRGRVLQPDGGPCEDADVAVLEWLDDERQEVAKGRSGAGGEFSLVVPGVSARWSELVATAPGRGLGMAQVGADDTSPITIQLVAERPLRGVVMDLDGRPLPARVSAIFNAPDPSDDDERFERHIRATCDADGAFSLAGIPAGARIGPRIGAQTAQVLLRVSLPGWRTEEIEVFIPREGRKPVRVHLARECTVSGWVRSEDGRGVAQAEVRVGRESTRSDEQGWFELAGSERTELSVKAAGFAKATFELQRPAFPIDLVLLRGGTISGRVIGALSKPGDCSVSAHLPKHSPTEKSRTGEARRLDPTETGFWTRSAVDGEGRFTFEDVPREVDLVLSCEGATAVARAGEPDVELVVPESGELACRVVDGESGEEIEGEAWELVDGQPRHRWSSGRAPLRGRGAMELVFRAQGRIPVRRSVVLEPGRTVDLGAIPLVTGAARLRFDLSWPASPHREAVVTWRAGEVFGQEVIKARSLPNRPPVELFDALPTGEEIELSVALQSMNEEIPPELRHRSRLRLAPGELRTVAVDLRGTDVRSQ